MSEEKKSTDVTEVTKNAVSGMLPEGWTLRKLVDKTAQGCVKFRVNFSVRVPEKAGNYGILYEHRCYDGITEEYYDGMAGTGDVEQIRIGVELAQEQIEKEIKAHLEAQSIIANEGAVAQYLAQQRIKQIEKEKEEKEKEERQAKQKIEDEKRAAEREKEEKRVEVKRAAQQKIKDTYRPDWLSTARDALDIDGKRVAEKKRFLEAWEITEEQFDACNGYEERRASTPYIFLKFAVAGLLVANQREYVTVEMSEYYSTPDFSDKDEAFAKSLAKTLEGQEEYIEEDDNETALAVRVGSDYIYIERKDQVEGNY